MEEQAAYLDDPVFSEPHRGCYNVDANGIQHGRDPDPDQVIRMCRAIRRAIPRPMCGEHSGRFNMPMASEDCFGVRTVDRFP